MTTAIRKILFVDDDDNIRLLIRMALESLTDWDVIALDRGEKAVELASHELPDVIMLDMMMPGIGGQQTLEQLRSSEICRNIPVLRNI
jgi:CheY-like chemotaxis protein